MFREEGNWLQSSGMLHAVVFLKNAVYLTISCIVLSKKYVFHERFAKIKYPSLWGKRENLLARSIVFVLSWHRHMQKNVAEWHTTVTVVAIFSGPVFLCTISTAVTCDNHSLFDANKHDFLHFRLCLHVCSYLCTSLIALFVWRGDSSYFQVFFFFFKSFLESISFQRVCWVLSPIQVLF